MRTMPGQERQASGGAFNGIKYMGMKAMPLVFTSFNPFKSVEWQLKCYKSFASTGHQIFSANHKVEIDHIRSSAIPISTIELSDKEVTVEKQGKPLGNIVSILKRMRDFDLRDHYALVNSDILFGGKKECIGQILANAPAAAMTRTDIAEQDADSNSIGLPYRGGLDIFLFTREGLEQTIQYLERYPRVCAEMTTGIPGWDYMTAAVILTEVKGKIIDSENLFQHAVHKQTYSDLSSFKTIASVLHSKSLVSSSEPNKAAADFVERVNHECNANTSHMRQTALIYRRHISSRADSSTDGVLSTLLSENTAKALKKLYHKKDLLAIKKAIRLIPEDPSREFLGIKNIFLKGNSFHLKILQLITCCSCMHELSGSRPRVTTKYPEENSHAQCIELIGRVEAKEERSFHIADLFYTELLAYNIFNPDLFAYLASIQTDRLFLILLTNQLITIKTSIQ